MVLIVSVSLASAYLINSQIKQSVQIQGEIITRMLADNSLFLLLVPANSEEAQQATQTFNSLPPVEYVEVVDANFKTIVMSGDRPGEWMLSEAALPVEQLTMVHDGECCWHFVAPVDTRESTSREVLSRPVESMRLGYIHVATSKTGVADVVRTLIITNALLLVALFGLLAATLLRRVSNIAGPLVKLATVMERAREEGSDVRAEVEGPAEAQKIAQTFNELMSDKASQSSLLEAQVRERTKELEHARDEALKAEREKAEIMAMFTHEMKAPLHAMGSYIADAASQIPFVKDTQTAERIKTALRIIDSESHELLNRINLILELRTLESGNAKVNVSDVDLRAILEELESTMQPLATEKANQLAVIHRGETPVRTDATMLRQILENLVSNACRFTENGSISVTVTTRPTHLDVVVEDTGIGIASEHHEPIFTPFYQVDMSDTRTHSGTGLGLAVVKRVTELLDATLHFQSAPGEGTRIEIHIPLAAAGAD